MEHLPSYISIVFILTALLTLFMLWKANRNSRMALLVILWLALQAIIGLTRFYTVTDGTPPRFALLVMPPVFFIIILFLIKAGRRIMDSFDVKTLTLLQVVRIPVEITLYWLCLHKLVPAIMTFEGRNFDILCGLTAPLIYYFGYVKNVFSRGILIGWNVVCLLLLTNIVVTAVLSAPLPFQRFGFDQPNIALFYFPFVWLPCFIAPVALFSHLVLIRKLIMKTV